MCVSTRGSWGFLFFVFFVIFLFGWQEGGLYRRVERHSLCPVFTSLEFKWSAGRLRLPFTSRHLHFPLRTVHSQLLIRPHPPTLHTNSHTYSTNIFFTCFLSSYFQRKQTYTASYKPLTTIHKCRCAHGINTACGHKFCFFCLNIHFSYSSLL